MLNSLLNDLQSKGMSNSAVANVTRKIKHRKSSRKKDQRPYKCGESFELAQFLIFYVIFGFR